MGMGTAAAMAQAEAQDEGTAALARPTCWESRPWRAVAAVPAAAPMQGLGLGWGSALACRRRPSQAARRLCCAATAQAAAAAAAGSRTHQADCPWARRPTRTLTLTRSWGQGQAGWAAAGPAAAAAASAWAPVLAWAQAVLAWRLSRPHTRTRAAGVGRCGRHPLARAELELQLEQGLSTAASTAATPSTPETGTGQGTGIGIEASTPGIAMGEHRHTRLQATLAAQQARWGRAHTCAAPLTSRQGLGLGLGRLLDQATGQTDGPASASADRRAVASAEAQPARALLVPGAETARGRGSGRGTTGSGRRRVGAQAADPAVAAVAVSAVVQVRRCCEPAVTAPSQPRRRTGTGMDMDTDTALAPHTAQGLALRTAARRRRRLALPLRVA